MSNAAAYETRRSEIETYFDRTAADTWKRLTSDAPVGRIRASVRAGRDEMRTTLLSMLPDDLSGRRILDAGCGTGAFAIEAAGRGADVVAVDLSPTLVEHAHRLAHQAGFGSKIAFCAGDMLASALGRFDHVVLMDSLIHYERPDTVAALASLAGRASESIVFTFAPKTPMLALMHSAGKLFPRSDRSPAIVPVGEASLRRALGRNAGLDGWEIGRDARVSSGFYKSHAMELVRS